MWEIYDYRVGTPIVSLPSRRLAGMVCHVMRHWNSRLDVARRGEGWV